METELDFERRYRLPKEIIETVVLTVLMFLVIRLAVQNFNIDGHSMEPNLHDQELILVDKWSYLFHPPGRGDVIVFTAPPVPKDDYIKRVIGLPGDVVTVQDNTVIVNGKILQENYVSPANLGNFYQPIVNRVIPPDMYFVLGDNRRGSSDSRDWGCVPKKNIIGRAAFVYWPLGQDNNGLLPNVSAAFKDVPSSPKNLTGSSMCTVSAPRYASTPTLATMPFSDSSINLDGVMMIAMPAVFVAWRRRKQAIA